VRIAIGSPTVPAGQNVSVSIWRAGSGSVVLDGGAVASGSSKDLTLTSLPATDTYYVWLIPWFNATGMATVTLNP
jgi:hypothetical protein